MTHAFGASDETDLKQSGYKIAFGMIDYLNGEVHQDEMKVQWQVKMNEKVSLNTVKSVDLDFHICTQADFEEFYPVAPEDAQFLE